MSERKEQADSTVRDEVTAVVQRARDAAGAIEHYTQEQVDELVTAVAWAVVAVIVGYFFFWQAETRYGRG